MGNALNNVDLNSIQVNNAYVTSNVMDRFLCSLQAQVGRGSFVLAPVEVIAELFNWNPNADARMLGNKWSAMCLEGVDTFLFPWHKSRMRHWTLFIVSISARVVTYVDSLSHGRADINVSTRLSDFLCGFRKQEEPFRLEHCVDRPLQDDSNCGAFVMWFAFARVSGKPFGEKQEGDMVAWRKHVLSVILTKDVVMIGGAEEFRVGYKTTTYSSALSAHDLEKVKRIDGWLNDVAVNLFIEILSFSPQHNKTTHWYDSLVLNKLQHGEDVWEKCKPFEREFDFLFFPAHVQGNHWVLIWVERDYQVCWYDPLQGNDTTEASKAAFAVQEFLFEKWGDQVDEDDESAGDYPQPMCRDPTQVFGPTQQNSYDCGVFVCYFAEHLARTGNAPAVAQWDGQMLRRALASTLVTGVVKSF
jgi:Ulp1 family protease